MYLFTCQPPGILDGLTDVFLNEIWIPGEHISHGSSVSDGRAIEPFTTLSKLGNKELTADAWTEECHAAGIDRLTLA